MLHRESCTEFIAPFLCSCGFSCGTDSAYERHCSQHAPGTHKRVAPSASPPLQTQVKQGKDVGTEVRVILLGFDRSGKTTIVKNLFQEADNGEYKPTQGVNMKSHSSGDPPLKLVVTEVGGRQETRAHWGHFLSGMDGFMYVVDIGDDSRMEDSCSELCTLLRDDRLSSVPFLLLANRRGSSPYDSKSVEQRIDELIGDVLKSGPRAWHVQHCNASTGEGVQQGVAWLESSFVATGKLPRGTKLFGTL